MKVYIIIKDERFELEDPFAIQEPLQNQSWYFQKDGVKQKLTIYRVDNIFISSGRSLDVIKELYLE